MVLGKTFLCLKRADGEKISVLLEQRGHADALLFEGGVVAELGPAETDAVKKLYSKVVEAYGCLGALRLFIGEACYVYLFFVTGCLSVGKIEENEIFRITNCTFVPLQEQCELDIRITDVQKLLMSGCFFFSWSPSSGNHFDLTLSAQRLQLQEATDDRHFWNRSLHFHLQRFGISCNEWLLRIMCGCVEIRTVYVGAKQAKACLISRLSCKRAGTRFNVRGVDDEGHAANFVETEQVIILDNLSTSFVQTRGSVPLFWEQPGVQVGSHKVKISRGYEASSPAFDRHILGVKNIYGYQLLVNLLGKKEGENTLSIAFRDHLKDSRHSYDTHMIMFDYHNYCRGGRENLKILLDKAQPSLDNFQFFFAKDGEVIKSQAGAIRTNCLDCLDRTNAVQTTFGITILREQLSCLGLLDKPSLVARFVEVYKSLWTLNGDHVSKMYSGTGALESGTKGTVASKLHDGAVSVKRTFRNNFLDGSKQGAIDILLLRNAFTGAIGERARALLNMTFLSSTPTILKELCYRHEEFTDIVKFKVCVGTWNVNGGKHFRSIAYKHQSMHDWLIDFHKLSPEGITDKQETFEKPPDIYALGFEELVDLNTSNIISTRYSYDHQTS